MHELSIAMSLVDVAAEEMNRQGGGRVQVVHLRLGQLSGVIKEALLSAYDLATENSPLAGSRLIIQDIPVEILCPQCHAERSVDSIQDMRCRVCGTASANVIRGREIELAALEVSDDTAASQGTD